MAFGWRDNERKEAEEVQLIEYDFILIEHVRRSSRKIGLRQRKEAASWGLLSYLMVGIERAFGWSFLGKARSHSCKVNSEIWVWKQSIMQVCNLVAHVQAWTCLSNSEETHKGIQGVNQVPHASYSSRNTFDPSQTTTQSITYQQPNTINTIASQKFPRRRHQTHPRISMIARERDSNHAITDTWATNWSVLHGFA